MIKTNTLALLLFLLFFSGVIRHDVAEKAYTDLAAEPQFDCVGQLMLNDSTPLGSCVLIKNNTAITAAHCFDVFERSTPGDGPEKTKVVIKFKDKPVKILEFIVHKEYRRSNGKKADLALLKLAEEVKDIIPAKLNKSFDELNSKVVGVGYGVSGKADQPETVTHKNLKKIAGENTVDKIYGKKMNRKSSLLSCDFDHPTNKKCNVYGSELPLPLEYICAGGDSGGGLFRQKDGSWELIGICAGGGVNVKILLSTGYYGQIMDWTRIAVFSDWVEASK